MTKYGKANHALFETNLDRRLADHLAKPSRRKGRTAAEIVEANPEIGSAQGVRNALARMANTRLITRNGSRAQAGVYALTEFGMQCQQFSAQVEAGALPEPPAMTASETVDQADVGTIKPQSDGMELMVLLMTKAAANGAGPDVIRGLADLMVLAKEDPAHPTIQVIEYVWAGS